jgi:hypothetical protein
MRGALLDLNVKKDIFLDFAYLDLFFQTEASVSPCFCKPLVLKCTRILKNKRNRQKTRLPSLLCQLEHILSTENNPTPVLSQTKKKI